MAMAMYLPSWKLVAMLRARYDSTLPTSSTTTWTRASGVRKSQPLLVSV